MRGWELELENDFTSSLILRKLIFHVHSCQLLCAMKREPAASHPKIDLRGESAHDCCSTKVAPIFTTLVFI